MTARVAGNQFGRHVMVTGGKCMLNSLTQQALFAIPTAGACMIGWRVIGRDARQFRPQTVGKEMMVAMPATPIIQWDYKEAGLVEDFQHVLASALGGDRIAQLAIQSFQHRCLEQKVVNVRRLSIQHFADQIVDDVTIVAFEGLDEFFRIDW